jgi:hypothetical protein
LTFEEEKHTKNGTDLALLLMGLISGAAQALEKGIIGTVLNVFF